MSRKPLLSDEQCLSGFVPGLPWSSERAIGSMNTRDHYEKRFDELLGACEEADQKMREYADERELAAKRQSIGPNHFEKMAVAKNVRVLADRFREVLEKFKKL